MTQHRVGEKVRVTIEGTITEVDGEHGEHIEITYAFTDRFKATLGVFPGAVAASVNSLEDGALVAEASPVLTLGDRWRDSDGDSWRVALDGNAALGLTLGHPEAIETWAFVNEQYGPLTLVKPNGTVAISTLSPKSFAIYPGWNDGKPVALLAVEESNGYVDHTFVRYQDIGQFSGPSTAAHVPSDTQVTPCTLDGSAL